MNGEQRLTELEQLIAEFKRSGLRELQVRRGDLEIYLSHDAESEGLDGGTRVQVAQSAPAAKSSAAGQEQPKQTISPIEADLPEGAIMIRAPYLGTFYRSPKPGSPPYVELGSVVAAESELCLVEVMKLFTAVRAGTAGQIVRVFASDGELVTSDQPLFAVMPG